MSRAGSPPEARLEQRRGPGAASALDRGCPAKCFQRHPKRVNHTRLLNVRVAEPTLDDGPRLRFCQLELLSRIVEAVQEDWQTIRRIADQVDCDPGICAAAQKRSRTKRGRRGAERATARPRRIVRAHPRSARMCVRRACSTTSCRANAAHSEHRLMGRDTKNNKCDADSGAGPKRYRDDPYLLGRHSPSQNSQGGALGMRRP